jgi:hypothetical protein
MGNRNRNRNVSGNTDIYKKKARFPIFIDFLSIFSIFIDFLRIFLIFIDFLRIFSIFIDFLCPHAAPHSNSTRFVLKSMAGGRPSAPTWPWGLPGGAYYRGETHIFMKNERGASVIRTFASHAPRGGSRGSAQKLKKTCQKGSAFDFDTHGASVKQHLGLK